MGNSISRKTTKQTNSLERNIQKTVDNKNIKSNKQPIVAQMQKQANKKQKLNNQINIQIENHNQNTKQQNSKKLSWDENTPFSQMFSIQQGKMTSKIDCKGFQITSLQQLPPEKSTDVKVKINRYSSNGVGGPLAVGILTINRKEMQWSGYTGSDHIQSVGYWMIKNTNSYGCIYVDGRQCQSWNEDLGLQNNNELMMQVDLINYAISFINPSKSNKEWKYELKQDHWRTNKIFIYLVAFEADNIIQINLK